MCVHGITPWHSGTGLFYVLLFLRSLQCPHSAPSRAPEAVAPNCPMELGVAVQLALGDEMSVGSCVSRV